jgi:hypothetical protein
MPPPVVWSDQGFPQRPAGGAAPGAAVREDQRLPERPAAAATPSLLAHDWAFFPAPRTAKPLPSICRGRWSSSRKPDNRSCRSPFAAGRMGTPAAHLGGSDGRKGGMYKASSLPHHPIPANVRLSKPPIRNARGITSPMIAREVRQPRSLAIISTLAMHGTNRVIVTMATRV